MKPYVVAGLLVLFSLIFCIAAALAGGEDPYYHFDEYRIATWFNALQIFLCAPVGVAIFQVRRKQEAGRDAFFWIAVAVGSAYLALDEILSFHDDNGLLISTYKKWFHVELPYNAIETKLFYLSYSDFILIGYGLAVVVIAIAFRRELLRCLYSKWFFVLGTLLLVASVTIDFNVLMKLHHSLDLRGYNKPTLHVFEETFKTVGFSCFLAGLLHYYLTIRKR